MGTILASSIIQKAGTQLQDVTGVRWDAVELLGWLNEAQAVVVMGKPSAHVRTLAVRLAAGTRQALPVGGVLLLDVPRNMGTNGTTPGRAVRMTLRAELDARAPNWHATKPEATVRHFMPVEHDPKAFFVYPANTGTGFVELVFGAVPPQLNYSDPIALDDLYEAPLLDYVLYRAFNKDTEVADESKATRHYSAFATALGVGMKAEASTKPKDTAPAAGPVR